MKNISSKDVECRLKVEQIYALDYDDRFAYENGKKTDEKVGYTVDAIGYFEDGVKSFSIKCDSVEDKSTKDEAMYAVTATELKATPYTDNMGRMMFSVKAEKVILNNMSAQK